MRMRLIGVAGGWAVVASLATAVSWGGVALVGAEVSPAGPAALSQAEVQRRITVAGVPSTGTGGAVAPTATSGPRTGPPAGTGSEAAGGGTSGGVGPQATDASRRSVVTTGGTVVLSCTGDRIGARWSASPGYVMSEDPGKDPSKVQVEFSNGTVASTVRAVCGGGTLTVNSTEGHPDD